MEQIDLARGRAAQPHLNAEDLSELRLWLPARRLQRAIADYLDTETARIDALIEKKRRMAHLMKESADVRQRALATTGTRPTALRSSGHNWLGAIPEHWPVCRLKFIARLESGHTPSRTRPEFWENCTTPWITLNDVGYLETHEFIEETVNLISAEGLAGSSARVLPTGTVVLSRDATVGRSGIITRPMATSQHFANWCCSEDLRPRYLWLLFRTAMQAYFESLTDGATLRTIGIPDIKKFVVPLPPLDEQDAIVREVEEVRSVAAKAITALDRQVSLLMERRQALITAAVTGELDIPGVAA